MSSEKRCIVALRFGAALAGGGGGRNGGAAGLALELAEDAEASA
jgi:hypothetical protein